MNDSAVWLLYDDRLNWVTPAWRPIASSDASMTIDLSSDASMATDLPSDAIMTTERWVINVDSSHLMLSGAEKIWRLVVCLFTPSFTLLHEQTGLDIFIWLLRKNWVRDFCVKQQATTSEWAVLLLQLSGAAKWAVFQLQLSEAVKRAVLLLQLSEAA